MSNFHLYLFVSICRDVSNINLDNIFDLGTFNVIRDTEMEQRKHHGDYFLRKIRNSIFLQTIGFVMVLFPLISSLSLFSCFIFCRDVFIHNNLWVINWSQNHNVRFNTSFYPSKISHSLLFILYNLSLRVTEKEEIIKFKI